MNNDSLNIVPLDFNDPRLNDFIRLPWRVNENDANWVPPIIREVKKNLNPDKGPFYEFGEAQLFLALRNGEPVGRISAHTNGRWDEKYQDGTGFFGFFACLDDPEAAAGLLDAASAWLKERGKTRILGPLSFSIYDDEVGVLVDGFDTMPVILQSHNPPFFQTLLRKWGMRKAVDWYAYKVHRLKAEEVEPMERIYDSIVKRLNLKLTHPKPGFLLQHADEVMRVFNETWEGNWGHIPFTSKEFRRIVKEIKPILRADFCRMALDEDGNIAGFLIVLPNLNPVVKRFNGKLTPWSIFKLLLFSRFPKLGGVNSVRVTLLGVKKQFQGRRLHHAMILRYILDMGTGPEEDYADCSLIVEDNLPMIRAMKAYKADLYKVFRLFEREID